MSRTAQLLFNGVSKTFCPASAAIGATPGRLVPARALPDAERLPDQARVTRMTCRWKGQDFEVLEFNGADNGSNQRNQAPVCGA